MNNIETFCKAFDDFMEDDIKELFWMLPTSTVVEEWRDIQEYEGLYQVSSLGRVKSLGKGNSNNSKEKILKLDKNYKGYLQINLYKDGKLKHYRVHRLVANAFIPNPNNYEEINHKDENKENNCVENLEWCNRQYNAEYSKAKQVQQYTLDDKLINTFPSTHEIERQLGYSCGNISRCCNGKIKKAYGFIWKYAI